MLDRMQMLNVACPFDVRVKEKEKIDNYEDLKRELRRICKSRRVIVVPIIIGALLAGLDVATCGVANATSFYSVAIKFPRLVANLATKIGDFLLLENVH